METITNLSLFPAPTPNPMAAAQFSTRELPPSVDDLVFRNLSLLMPIARLLCANTLGRLQPEDLLDAGMTGLISGARSYRTGSAIGASMWLKNHIRRAMLERCSEIIALDEY